MESLLAGIGQHGYVLLFVAVLAEALGIPVPAALALLIAGAACARGSLVPGLTAACGLTAMLIGDVTLFWLGRLTGWWLLGLLCRVSLNPESCILRSADAFYRRGRTLLVVAKFIPGINSMAPPLAGSMNMRFTRFFALDLAGACLYIGAYLSAGFLFSDAMEKITTGYHAMGWVMGWAGAVGVGVYLAIRAWSSFRSRNPRSVPFVTPDEAALAVAADIGSIFDVRSHGYYDSKTKRVKGSKRLDPHALNQWEAEVSRDRPMYLYCTCLNDATSVRVAKELLGKGIPAAVIRGGLGAWKKAGLPLEPVPAEEVALLPVFDS